MKKYSKKKTGAKNANLRALRVSRIKQQIDHGTYPLEQLLWRAVDNLISREF